MFGRGKLGGMAVDIEGNLAPLKKHFAQARQMGKQQGGVVSKAFAGAFSMKGFAALAGGAAIGGFLKSAFDEAVAFEQQMANVSTMLTKDTMPALEGMSDAVERLSMEMGEGTETLSKGLYDILSAGVAASKAAGVLEVAAKAAQAGMTSTAVSADVITTMLNAYSQEADLAADVSDRLFKTVALGKTTLPELTGALGNIVSTARAAGVAQGELLGVLVGLMNQGISTDEAVTALNATINSFLKPSDEAAAMAEKLGLELSATALATKGLYNAIADIVANVDVETLVKIFPERRALKAATAIQGALKKTGAAVRDLNENYLGSTEEALEKVTDTTKKQLERQEQMWNHAYRKIGGIFTGYVGSLVFDIEHLFSDMTSEEVRMKKFYGIDVRPEARAKREADEVRRRVARNKERKAEERRQEEAEARAKELDRQRKAEQKLALSTEVADKIARITMEEYDYQRWELDRYVAKLREKHGEMTEIAEYEAARRKQIARDEADEKVRIADQTRRDIERLLAFQREKGDKEERERNRQLDQQRRAVKEGISLAQELWRETQQQRTRAYRVGPKEWFPFAEMPDMPDFVKQLAAGGFARNRMAMADGGNAARPFGGANGAEVGLLVRELREWLLAQKGQANGLDNAQVAVWGN